MPLGKQYYHRRGKRMKAAGQRRQLSHIGTHRSNLRPIGQHRFQLGLNRMAHAAIARHDIKQAQAVRCKMLLNSG